MPCAGGPGTRGRRAGGDDEVGVGVLERVEQGVEGVGHADGREGASAEPGDPARDHRPEGVADATVAGRAAVEQLVAEDEDRDVGRPDHRQGVVPGRRRHAGDHRRDDAAGLEQVLPRRALATARPDVRPRLDVARVRSGQPAHRVADPQLAPVHPVVLEKAVLTTEHGVGTGRQCRAGRDRDCGAVDEVVEHLTRPAARRRPSTAPGPATAKPSIADVSNAGSGVLGHERRGEHRAHRRRERHRHHRQRPGRLPGRPPRPRPGGQLLTGPSSPPAPAPPPTRRVVRRQCALNCDRRSRGSPDDREMAGTSGTWREPELPLSQFRAHSGRTMWLTLVSS